MEDNVRVVDRIFDILEQLAQADSSMGLSGIAQATGMSKSTIHRLLSSLCARQYVAKLPDNTYTIGYKMVEMVSSHIYGLELITESKPYLNYISHELDLTTHLGILDHDEVIYIEKMDTYPNIGRYTQVGYRSPAYCSSIGKCLLSCLSGDELEEALYGCSFKKYTANTITDPREFKRVLKVIRKQGWALDNEEFKTGHRCVAAPIYDYRGFAIAAISASGSTISLSDDKLEHVIKMIRESAVAISRRMGYVD